MSLAWPMSGFGDEADTDPVVRLGVLHALGAEHIEVRGAWGVNVVDLTDDQLDTLHGLIKERGMGVSAIGSPVGRADHLADFTAELRRLDRAIIAAHRLGSRYLRVFSFSRPPGVPAAATRDEVLARMRVFAALAAREDLILLHENDQDGYGDVPSRVLDLIEGVGSDALRVAWNGAGFVRAGVRPFTDGYRLLRPHLEYLRVGDADAATGAFVPPGEGDAQLLETLTALRDDGYAGFIALDGRLAEMSESGPPEIERAAHAFAMLTERTVVR